MTKRQYTNAYWTIKSEPHHFLIGYPPDLLGYEIILYPWVYDVLKTIIYLSLAVGTIGFAWTPRHH